MNVKFRLRELRETDRRWIVSFLKEHWGSTKIVSRGRLQNADALRGFLVTSGGRKVGLATYHIEDNGCEIATINSVIEGVGIGSALIGAVKRVAIASACRRLWLVTTNDNTQALRFYQKKGFSLVAIYRDAMEEARELKPEIPLVGVDGIPIRDEIELEMIL